MGDYVISMRFYRGCVVSIHGRKTLVDLIELDMLDFNVIMEIDCIHSCYASLDCQTQRVSF